MTSEPTDPLVESAEQIHLFREVMDDRVEALSKRTEQVNSRAALLITAAALTSTLSTSNVSNTWAILAMVMTLAAAAVGVVSIFPTKATYPDPSELRTRFLESTVCQAELDHADAQVTTYDEQVKKLHRRARWVQVGFLLLGSSILFRSLLILGVSVRIG
ncbi:hypothetical protein [Paenarthrobacter ilicis]|uniref:hypothetical protein n=1 Tax=Paenarthrobacter ilicis TaxID=43665 RepID=UPI00386DC740